MRLAFSEYWVWFLGLPVTIGILILVFRRVSQITNSWFSREEYLLGMPKLKLGLRIAAMLFLLIGLVGPYFKFKEKDVAVMGREIYFLLDVSGSMNAVDVKPSRLERAKIEVKKILPRLAGDKVGLILFTDYAFVQCPLTLDHRALETMLDVSETAEFAQTGTRFRNALLTVMDRFLRVETSANTSRAIVVVTDGEDFGDTYASLIDRMDHFDIRIFPVGVGTYQGAPVPLLEDREVVGYASYEDGSTVNSRLVDTELRNIASTFNTPFITLEEASDDLAELGDRLTALSSSDISKRRQAVEGNTFQWFLLLAFICLAASMFLMPISKEKLKLPPS